MLLFLDLVESSRAVTAETSRLGKRDTLAALIRAAGPDVALAVAYLTASPRQRRTGITRRSLFAMPAAAESAALTLRDVDRALDEISGLAGAGSAAARQTALDALLARATAPEQTFLRALLLRELRQGALEGVLTDAVAVAADVPLQLVRRAAMLSGSLSHAAVLAMTGGAEALATVGLMVGSPVQPMLAASAPTVTAAMQDSRSAGGAKLVFVDTKIDGVRVQIHKNPGGITVFSRSLDDITPRVPEVVETVAGLAPRTMILDGEVIALDGHGRPRPFQVTGGRVATREREKSAAAALSLVVFDLLHLDGDDLIDQPASERFTALDRVAGDLVVSRIATADPAVAELALASALAAGHEGVVIKRADALYAAGRRGSWWIKVKPVRTLDLVVLGVEWGSGRRTGRLSNIHLGARDPETGAFVMVGKTFKGMTDEMLEWQTRRFLELETHRENHLVWVRPEQVVEIAFDGVQRSRRYPGGVALRFARVLRYRDDKAPGDVDEITTLQNSTL